MTKFVHSPVILCIEIVFILFSLTKTSSKRFERCEFANILRYYYDLDLDEVAQWVCIAQETSGLNSSSRSLDSHGLFQINERFWCSPPGSGCNVECDKLRDDHITDDLACAKIIHAEHQRISGDGYTAWPVYHNSCRNQSFAYINNCFGNQLTGQYQGYTTKNYSRNEKSKIYGRCELARELYEEHNIPIEQVATWICIAQHESHFNTSAVGRRVGDGSIAYGLFQISNLRWCSYKQYGLNRLIDDNIADDVECIKRIYKEHAALFGDGFTAWIAYLPYCRNQHYEHIASCFEGEESNGISYKRSASSLHLQYVDNPFFKQKKTLVPDNDVFQVKQKDVILETKVYTQCSLAQELYFKHNIPIYDVATWICIAQHASHFDTSKIGPIGDDDSKSYGLFQINDRYWCSRYSYDGKGCNVPCANLLDSDISDDIRCIKLIQKEHERISGDGFDAWTHYKSHCQNENVTRIAKCFDTDKLKKDLTKNNSLKSNNITKKIYKYCELAQELYHKHHMPMEQIPTWVCIAQHESSFNTAAIGRLNADGSADHGLFQISDLYWCSHDRYGSKACGIPCDNLLDSDISDDIRCVRTIYEEHTRISGNGFTAWTVYQPHCRNKHIEDVNQCFNESELREALNIAPSTNKNSIKTNFDTKSSKKGKIYNKCELAQELYHKHHMPMEQIPTWVCIAQHESSFNTAAIGRLNADGSADHGLFQISDLYWCSHDRYGSKACGIPCDNLLDSDISDDIRCVRTIYEEHTRISGNGFTAWTVYRPHCRNKHIEDVNQCFSESELRKALNIAPSTNRNSIKTNFDTKSSKKGKIYNKCELAQELYHKHHMPMEQIPTWVCIAQHESSFNTAAIGRLNADGSADHGLFQISDLYWCSHDRYGSKACGIPCDNLLDSDISDDIRCVRTIYEEHTRISGNGFTAWTVYQPHCRNKHIEDVNQCFSESELRKALNIAPSTNRNSIKTNFDTKSSKKGKIYNKCELAQELYHKHHMPMEQIPTWVCIAQHETSFNTAAIGRLNADGSADHGLFQISDLYWCSHDRYGSKACGIPCDNLLDSDISDDIRCVRTIYEEHTRISGNGFTAWTVYQPHCRNKHIEDVNQCFNESELREALNIAPSTNKNSIKTNFDTKSSKKGKIYNKCELAQELYHKHHMPMEQIPTWVCIAQHESSFNTAAIGRLNADGSADHGLFQISDLYWCSHDRYGSKACGIPCDNLLDSDISDDIRCVRTIYEEHTRISGNGFTAWTVYQPHCRNKHIEDVNQCFNESELREALNIAPSTNKNSIKTNFDTKSSKKGKIYNKCELAQELYHKHHMPMEQIPTWVCIAQHESSFNTAAIGRLNADGSADHGLFQISDLYWCSHDRYGSKACGIPCDNLLDSDISDDIRCVRTIYEEHTRISGNGFTAWTVYQPHCRNKHIEDVNQCFNESELREALNIAPSTNKNSIKTNFDTKSSKKGKIYNKCELAQELYHKHHMPMEQIPTWVCIAQHESSFNTAAIGRLNADGSADHGLFQISDLYWCSHDRKGGKACSIPCDKLLDADISDDVRCIKIIYDQHTRISGDGFTAWTVYKPYCHKRPLHEIVSCFPSQKVDKIEKSIYTMNDVRNPKLYEQFSASQDVNIKNLDSFYKSNLFLNGLQRKHENPTTTTVVSYDYNPFVNGSIKLQVKGNDSQMYKSNPFLNNNSKNNKLGHTSKDSSTKSPSYPHYALSNVSTEKTQTLRTFSSTNKPALTWNSSTDLISRHLIASTIKPNLTDINKVTTEIRKISLPATIAQAKPIKETTIWQSDKKDSLRNVDKYEQLSKISRIVSSTSKIPSTTVRTTILTKYTNTVISTITTKQHITKQSTSTARNFMESTITPFAETKEKKSKTIITATNGKSSTQGKAGEKTSSSNHKTSSRILDWSETAAEKPPTQKPAPTNVTSATRATKWNIITTKRPQSTWLTSKQPNALGHITGRRVANVTNSSTTQNPIGKSIKSNKLLLSYDWASYMKAFSITSAIATTKQPFTTRTSYNSHDRRANTTKLSTTIKWRTTTTKSPAKATTFYSTSTTKPNLTATAPYTDPFDHPFFARFKEQFKKNNVRR